MFKKTSILYVLPAVIIATLLVTTLIFAWAEPSTSPPGANISAPVNIGTSTQYKSGALGVGGVFRAYTTAIFDANVGIGTASPATILHVQKSDTTAYSSSRAAPYSYSPYSHELEIKNSSSGTANSFTGLFFYAGDDTPGVSISSAAISAVRSAAGGNTDLTFGTRAGGNLGEKMRITSGGNVGIGTTTPGAKLEVSEGSMQIGNNVQLKGKTAAGTVADLIGSNPSNVVQIGHSNWASMQFFANSGTARMTIDTSGNVGIGTTTPATKLAVSGAISGFGIVPIGSIIAWHKSLTGTPALPDGWVECNGQTLNDSASPYNGQVIPNLNGDTRFLRGSSVSGTLQEGSWITNQTGSGNPGYPLVVNSDGSNSNLGSSTYFNPLSLGSSYTLRGERVRPINMSVVWIMRVK